MQRTIKIGQLEITTPRTYYWVVRGKIPLKLAKELYELDVEKKIRVDGRCEAPKPELPWVKYYCKKTQKQLISLSELSEILETLKTASPKFQEVLKEILTKVVGVNDITVGEGFVETYHIDSDEALNLFLQKCEKYGLLAN